MIPSENLFYVPSLNKNPVKSSVIAVIDSSGSMSSWWPDIAENWNSILSQNPEATAITFSNSAKIIKEPLSHNINNYEGGGTEIEKGFRELNTILKSDANIHPNLTILFVSDGCDNSPSTLVERLKKISIQIDKTKKCNFLSLAVGKGFPTFIAMELRSMYHNGDNNLPPVFLIEQPSKQTIAEQFRLLTPYLVHKASYKIKPPVKVFPWTEPQDVVQEGQWVITNENTVVVNEDTFEVAKKESISMPEFIDIIKFWLQELQVLSIKKDVKKDDIAIDFIRDMKNLYEKKTQGQKKEKLSFYERIMKRSGNDLLQDMNFLIKEIKSFSEENLLSKLSEQEAAKRLAIGTKVGKYHSKAMELRGLSVEDYMKIKQDFIQLLDKFKLSPESNQDPSMIILQNQKEIFLENDLKEGLLLCPSQYDLVETLPLVGHGIQVRRSEGALINPYLIEVKNIAKHHKILDTVSIQQNNNEMKLKVGMDDEEIVNAVLPLFDEKDYDLQPYINSKIFHLLMTFNVMLNVDTLYENAYSALLAAATVHLLGLPENQWRNNLLDLINKTFKITYEKSLGFKRYAEILINEPHLAMVTEHPECPVKCEDLSKPLLVLNYLKLQDKNNLRNIMNRIFIEYFGRNFPNEFSLSDYYILEDEKAFEKIDISLYYEHILTKYTFECLNTFYTKYELRDDIKKEVDKLDLKIGFDFNIILNKKNLYSTLFKINLPLLERVYKDFVGEDINIKNYFLWIYHGYSHRNSYERNTSPILEDFDKIIKEIKGKMVSDFFKNQQILEKIWEKIKGKYFQIICEQHFYVTPFSQDSIIEYCSNHGLDQTKYIFNNCSNLFVNACLAPKCPFYMKINNSLAQHLEGNIAMIPAFNKTVKILCEEQDDEIIYNHILNMDYLDKSFASLPKMGEIAVETATKTKDQILKFIRNLKEFYLKNRDKKETN